jgi:hypothetical protein
VIKFCQDDSSFLDKKLVKADTFYQQFLRVSKKSLRKNGQVGRSLSKFSGFFYK